MKVYEIFKDSKDILLMLVSNLIYVGFSTLFWFSGALFLTKEIFGQVSFTISISLITSSLVVFGFTAILMNFSPLMVSLFYILPTLLLGKNFYKHALKGIYPFNTKIIKDNFKTIALFGGISILRNFSSYLDKVIVGSWLGWLVLGEYQFIFQIYLLLQFFPASIQSYLIPEEARKSTKPSTLRVLIILSILLPIITILSSRSLINLFFPEYINIIIVIYIISLSIPFGTFASISVARLIAYQKAGYVLFAYILSLILQENDKY
ncbi:unnamed protein product [marine sediment metagenome]|uniref:Polysaccharide biosynthesis protein C-terminal domain-containing protein n=1 Tax=marine sediment metagenome TaxID=412755 RepID=X1ABM8_9ZZZZ